MWKYFRVDAARAGREILVGRPFPTSPLAGTTTSGLDTSLQNSRGSYTYLENSRGTAD
jgi:hypothetical protein